MSETALTIYGAIHDYLLEKSILNRLRNIVQTKAHSVYILLFMTVCIASVCKC